MATLRSLSLVGTLLATWSPLDVIGQSVIRVDPRPVCDRCFIELTPFVTLGEVEGAGAVAWEPSAVVKTSRSDFVVSQFVFASHLLAFDSDGDPKGTIGREGQGPGEFRHVTNLALLNGDTVVALDAGNARMSFLGPELQYARSAPMPVTFPYQATASADRLVINGSAPTADAVGLPLHEVSTTGELQASFGSVEGRLMPGELMSMQRKIAPSRRGGVWSAARSAYRLERWDERGLLAGTFLVDADWFRPYSGLPIPSGNDDLPPPIVMAVQEMGADTVAVLINVPAEDYFERRGPPVGTSDRGNPTYDLSVRQELNDTVVEVLDLNAGQVLATLRSEAYLLGWANEELVYGYRVDANGIPYIDVFRLELVLQP